jgi:hypothetical protein
MSNRSVVAGLSKQPLAQQRVDGGLPPFKLIRRSEGPGEMPLDMGAQNHGAHSQRERVGGRILIPQGGRGRRFALKQLRSLAERNGFPVRKGGLELPR